MHRVLIIGPCGAGKSTLARQLGFDLAFFFYLLGCNRGPRLRTEAALAGHEAKVTRLKSPLQLKVWLDSLPC